MNTRTINSKITLPMEKISSIASLIAIVTGALVIVGWALDLPQLTSILPGWPKMVANTAISILLGGISLALQIKPPGEGQQIDFSRLLGKLAGIIVSLIGLLTLAEYVFDWNAGIDQLVFSDPGGAVFPGRMSPNTAFSFWWVGMALAAMDWRVKGHRPAQFLALVINVIPLIAFVRYLFGISPFFGALMSIGMAFHTALGIFFICLGILSTRASYGLIGLLTGGSLGGIAARRILWGGLSIPFILNILVATAHREGYDPAPLEIAIHVMGILSMVIVLWLMLKIAGDLDAIAAEYNQAERQLNDVERRFRTIYEQTPDGIWIVDGESGKIVEFNTAAHQQLGYTREEFARLEIPDIEALESPEETQKHIENILRQGRDDFETRHRTKHGEIRHIFVTVQTIAFDGKMHFMSLIRDITERVRAEQELRAYRDHLEELVDVRTQELARSNNELEQFAYVASHDLQEPLRKIRAFGDRLAQKYDQALGEQGLDYLERMRSAASRGQDLINDLLTFSRVRTRAQPFEPVDLNPVVQGVLNDLEMLVAENQAQVELAALPTVDAEPLHMRQLFQNLISNALKFHREGVPPMVEIYSENCEDNGECRLIVRDNGIGFEEKYLDRIFMPFQRLHNRSIYSGTGIGLAVCKKIVDHHGGKITAQSAPGEGTTFRVRLPLKQNPTAAGHQDLGPRSLTT